ncbi:MAG: response regulator [Acidobacteria bacterium]|nr:response regulator [Acidobacteriota bacterium]
MSEFSWPEARILAVDDQAQNVNIIERLLRRAGFEHVFTTTDPQQARPLVEELRPDVILLDLHMPALDGFAVLDQLAPLLPPDGYLPIVFITADADSHLKKRALSMGAKDFVNKPFDATEIVLRIRNLLEARYLYLALQAQNETLEVRVRERTEELEQAQLEILHRLSRAADFRDDDTMQHTERVGRLSAALARELGMAKDEVQLLRRAAPLHDLGKIAIPDSILLKGGGLSDDEFGEMKTHTRIGARLLSGSTHPLLQMAEQIALTHHEQWDGSGYLEGLHGEAIPLVSRIVTVADVFDALTHARPYKRSWPLSEALDELKRLRGRQFDPDVVNALLRIVERGELTLDGLQGDD